MRRMVAFTILVPMEISVKDYIELAQRLGLNHARRSLTNAKQTLAARFAVK